MQPSPFYILEVLEYTGLYSGESPGNMEACGNFQHNPHRSVHISPLPYPVTSAYNNTEPTARSRWEEREKTRSEPYERAIPL